MENIDCQSILLYYVELFFKWTFTANTAIFNYKNNLFNPVKIIKETNLILLNNN